MNLRWLLAALLISSFFACLHFWALADFLYWRYRWFDTPMHILGGIAVGTFAITLLGRFRPFSYLAIIALVAFSWELFEYLAGITAPGKVDYAWDTAHDILNDAIGAILVYVVARYTVWRSA